MSKVQSIIHNSKSTPKRIFTIVFIAFSIQIGYFIIKGYYDSLYEFQKISLERLHGIANTVALQINADEHDVLMNTHKQKDDISKKDTDASYFKMHQILTQNSISNNLKTPIYTLVFDKQTNGFQFGVTSSEQPYFRHTYNHYPKSLLEKMEVGGTIDLYKDEFGSWLTAFAPLKNSKGETVALLMVDEKFDTILAYIQSVNFKNLWVSLLIFFITITALYYFLRKLVLKEQKDKDILTKSYLENKESNEKLQESEEKLKKYAKQLERSNKELTDFANIASHDLKAPVRGIMSFISLYERKNKKNFDEKDSEYIGFIKTNASQSLSLIENILNYSKIDKNIGQCTPVSINEVIIAVEHNLKANIDAKNAVIKVQPNMPTIMAHKGLLIPLFQNIINNAINYNESDPPIIEINAESFQKGQFIFSIKDNGIGIPEKHQKGIFDMFKRLHSSAQYEGTGIGLAFCSRIVANYNGEIWVNSEEGKGSTFYFILTDAPEAIVKQEDVVNKSLESAMAIV